MYYLNFKNNQATIDTYRFADAAATDMADIIAAKDSGRNETLVASLDLFIEEEAQKNMAIAEKCESAEELRNYILGDGDFLELLLEREFGLLLTDYPDLRDVQISQYDHLLEAFDNPQLSMVDKFAECVEEVAARFGYDCERNPAFNNAVSMLANEKYGLNAAATTGEHNALIEALDNYFN